jgi:hypothetical protein
MTNIKIGNSFGAFYFDNRALSNIQITTSVMDTIYLSQM